MRLYKIFDSIDGEVNGMGQGTMTTFIRFAGCNLSCPWCDTPITQPLFSGSLTTPLEISQELADYHDPHSITITGGEPLLNQNDIITLVQMLRALHPQMPIKIETNGTIRIDRKLALGHRCMIIMDIKTPSAFPKEPLALNVSWRINKLNMKILVSSDFIKFPIKNKTDFDWAVMKLRWLKNENLRAQVAFSPIAPLTTKGLFVWMGTESLQHLDVKLNVQIHKLVDLD